MSDKRPPRRWGRPDLKSFKVGNLYMSTHNDETYEFVGVAAVSELAGEDVGVFRHVLERDLIVATRKGYETGERFTPLGQNFEGETESLDDDHGEE
jgi:hypothetical protein